ncbi:MAG TPA: LysM peptidoglycan-binding domain-containing protein [Tepidisphaeraceae bacterium]|jgi:nucleoid-associated protein YgaU|nr:LysM peptidoglycan-binding domain-containing protein [Tepidisphaeraceae bacterium]HEV8605284.1 LysM peptidoglycan-binding domain-containing protein [Tepidisphaeraceae bacterium]
MRNDVKLGLAVGGLLLGVVLAYALFFSNTNKDRDKDSLAGRYSALEGGGGDTGQRPVAPSTADQGASDSNSTTSAPPANTNSNPPPAAVERQQGPVVDAAPNNLLGKSWHALLNEGVSANSTGTIVTPREPASGIVRTPVAPARETTTTTTLAEPPPAVSGPRRYTIKHGDTYWSIAKAEYGNSAYFGHIQRANPGIDPGRIKPGDSIILPDKNEVIAAAPAAGKQPSAADLVIDPAKQYRVQAGDNLSNISKKLYGRFDKWVQIYELNKELIGQNPAALKRDMILALPEPPLRVAGAIQ